MNVAEILSLYTGCKFDLIKKAWVKDLMETCLQLGKKSKKKGRENKPKLKIFCRTGFLKEEFVP